MSCEYLRLDAESAPFFAGLTFPNYRGVLEAFDADVHVAIGAATPDGEPIGLILAVRSQDSERPNELLSIYVDDEYRQQGIGTALLQRLQQATIERGHPYLTGDYAHNLPDVAALERLFIKCGCGRSPDELLMVSGSIRIGMGLVPDLPPLEDGLVFQAWAERNEADDEQIRAYAADKAHNAWLNPYTDMDIPIHEPTSLLLKQGERVIGWMVNHELRAGVIRYTRLFLSPDWRGKRLGIRIFFEAMHRHFALDPDSIAVFAAEATNSPMLNVIEYFRHNPAATFIRYITMVWSGKQLTDNSPDSDGYSTDSP